MDRLKNSRIIPIALVIILAILAIAGLVSLARIVFFSGSSTTATDIGRDSLLSTTVDRSVRMTVRGAIVGDDIFRSYQVTVTPSHRDLTTFTGYIPQQNKQIALGNNIPAYDQFVHALDRASFASGTELTGDSNDTRGICATGRLYTFEILNAGKAVKTLWTTTCSSAKGSLTAQLSTVRALFTAQIPNASATINTLDL